MGKFILVGIVLLLVVASWYFRSMSESSLRRKLTKDLDWLKLAESSDGKVMRKSIEDELEKHDKIEMRIKHKKAKKLLEGNVPCYFEHQRKGPKVSDCVKCTVKHSCMLCKSPKL